MTNEKLEELERLLAGLRAIVVSYEKKNPLRTADFHGEGCGCYRCAVDGCSAAINALPRLIESARELRALKRSQALDELVAISQEAGLYDAPVPERLGAEEIFRQLAERQEPLGADFEAAIGDRSTLYETDVPAADELETIRARHEACGHTIEWPDYDSFTAHTDRATLLRLLDAARRSCGR